MRCASRPGSSGNAGARAEAENVPEEALALCRSLAYPYAEVKALYEYGLLHMKQDEARQARECFEAALAICARLGERLYAQKIEETLAVLRSSHS